MCFLTSCFRILFLWLSSNLQLHCREKAFFYTKKEKKYKKILCCICACWCWCFFKKEKSVSVPEYARLWVCIGMCFVVFVCILFDCKVMELGGMFVLQKSTTTTTAAQSSSSSSSSSQEQKNNSLHMKFLPFLTVFFFSFFFCFSCVFLFLFYNFVVVLGVFLCLFACNLT